LIVNISGGLLLGFLLELTTGYLISSPDMRLFLATGFLGSYTTFSTWMVESVYLLRNGAIVAGLLNVVGSSLLGLLAALAGLLLARVLMG
ncbi:MAG: CrcB family protein, partial [Caldilineaceae bacterium]|nr:CrcB family protein [Caldilineaceae bacterium]